MVLSQLKKHECVKIICTNFSSEAYCTFPILFSSLFKTQEAFVGNSEVLKTLVSSKWIYMSQTVSTASIQRGKVGCFAKKPSNKENLFIAIVSLRVQSLNIRRIPDIMQLRWLEMVTGHQNHVLSGTLLQRQRAGKDGEEEEVAFCAVHGRHMTFGRHSFGFRLVTCTWSRYDENDHNSAKRSQKICGGGR